MSDRGSMRVESAAPQGGVRAVPVSGSAFRPSTDGQLHELWEGRTRVVLTPYSPPSIIGLLGFMGATLMVGAWQAGWYGDAKTGFVLWPFAAIFGGIFQGGAAFSSLRARDGLAAGIHATWGAFWIGFGLLFAMGSVGLATISPFGAVNTPFAFWFIVLGMVTVAGTVVAALANWAVFGVLLFLGAGSWVTAAGWWAGSGDTLMAGGVLFVISAVIAWYTATGMIVENLTGRALLPLGAHKLGGAKVPSLEVIEYPAGMPGVKVGQ